MNRENLPDMSTYSMVCDELHKVEEEERVKNSTLDDLYQSIRELKTKRDKRKFNFSSILSILIHSHITTTT